ncbi:DNA-directed RNA polymerase subunit K [Candidatus Caldarchaeum subterraneum]|uniref:DNA-directed RNA polymerase subunit Rpo6 n=1 Tax=Caldiarchaeum subterraneum TaxID=311458 RepID=E6P7T8_CALS0|nr:DNA-directed RNA polymerase II subunit F [Candidatus Caldarchaeum subterraneum]BAJ49999.1 DNA-directed RNA polymerase subunit K [Candidatus Caldarchaeum subterraneum]
MASQKTEAKTAQLRLTKYEKARIIGGRALQLSLGAFPLVEVRPGESNIDIAKREFERGVLPIIIRRKRFDGSYVDIPLKELLGNE